MLCEKCGQREANVRYTEVMNGTITEHNFCLECAREMDFGGHTHGAAVFDGESTLGKLLSGLLGFYMEDDAENMEVKTGDVTCPTCHTTYDDFVKKSRFGCPDCYEVFELLMGDHIKTIQGSNEHVGKTPKYMVSKSQQTEEEQQEQDLQEELDLLQSRLQESIQEEEYELAAQYRDQIRELKERMKIHE
jgi:protein arginine kinase activator